MIIFDLYSIEYSTKTRYLMFKLINFIVFCKYSLVLNLMPSVFIYSSQTPGWTQNPLQGLCISSGLGTPRGPPGGAGSGAGERDVWNTLLSLLPSRPDVILHFFVYISSLFSGPS